MFQALTDVRNDIENHFEMLFKTLQKRKEDLLCSADKLSQEFREWCNFLFLCSVSDITFALEKEIEVEKKELLEKVKATKKMINTGVLLYNCQRDMALEMWKVIF